MLPLTIAGVGSNRPIQSLQDLYQPHGVDPINDPGGNLLHQRGLAADDEFYADQRAQDLQTNDQFAGLHKNNEAQNRIGHMGTGGWGDFYQALNEAAPGGVANPKHEGDPMQGLSDSPVGQPSTMFANGQTSAVTGGHYGTTGYHGGQFNQGDTGGFQTSVKPFQETAALNALRKAGR